MRFKEAVEKTPEIKDAYRRGLQALRNADKRHVTAEDTRRLTGSVDLDTALKNAYPNDPRWDYGIGSRAANIRGEMVYWIEIHPANQRAVREVLDKLEWLKRWLKKKARALNAMRREFIWLSSGRTSFTPSSPQQKQLARLGLQHKGRVLNIPNITV